MISQSQWGVHEKLGPRFENIPTPSPSSGVFASRLRDCETVVVHWTVFVHGGPVHRDTTQGTAGAISTASPSRALTLEKTDCRQFAAVRG